MQITLDTLAIEKDHGGSCGNIAMKFLHWAPSKHPISHALPTETVCLLDATRVCEPNRSSNSNMRFTL